MTQRSNVSLRPLLVIANPSAQSIKCVRQFLFLLGVSALLMLSSGAGDINSARYYSLGYRLMCGCGCHDGLLECDHNPAGSRGSNLGKGPCEVALRMRNELKAAIQKGKTDDAILTLFVQEYGENVLLDPKTKPVGLRTSNWLDWLITFAGLLATLSIVMVLLRKWESRRRIAEPIAELPSANVDDLRQRVRRETERDEYGRPLL